MFLTPCVPFVVGKWVPKVCLLLRQPVHAVRKKHFVETAQPPAAPDYSSLAAASEWQPTPRHPSDSLFVSWFSAAACRCDRNGGGGDDDDDEGSEDELETKTVRHLAGCRLLMNVWLSGMKRLQNNEKKPLKGSRAAVKAENISVFKWHSELRIFIFLRSFMDDELFCASAHFELQE